MDEGLKEVKKRAKTAEGVVWHYPPTYSPNWF